MRAVNRTWKAVAIVLIGLIAGFLYPLLSKEFGNPYAIVNGLVIGLLGSLYIVIIELYLVNPHNRRIGFLTRWFRKTATYTVFLSFLILFVLTASRSIELGMNYSDYLQSDHFAKLIFQEDIHIIFLYTLFLSAAIIFVNQLSRKMGQGVLWNFITGHYHRPRNEHRIFMFLDLKDSTRWAERLGDEKFSNLLNDFFYDITPAIIATEGIIYRYVGDEVVVSWHTAQGIRNANCIRASFLANLAIKRRREYYLGEYGFAPEFRTGLHCGTVVVGEVGEVKSQIAFVGDVLYLGSAIESDCKAQGVDNLISQDLIQQISLPGTYQTHPVSSIPDNRGQDIKLYTVSEVIFTSPY
ncbi:MAG: adenylate/guanylate cyclase domain-containing protein [Saprospiraceae bacterium]|nr:adenylate/guanylate cyclase domain-containing protein [Saprospiraceae bacterium]